MKENRSQFRVVGQDIEGQRIWARREARSLLFKACLWFVATMILLGFAGSQNLPVLQIGAFLTFIPCLIKGLKAAHLWVKFLR